MSDLDEVLRQYEHLLEEAEAARTIQQREHTIAFLRLCEQVIGPTMAQLQLTIEGKGHRCSVTQKDEWFDPMLGYSGPRITMTIAPKGAELFGFVKEKPTVRFCESGGKVSIAKLVVFRTGELHVEDDETVEMDLITPDLVTAHVVDILRKSLLGSL